MGHGKAIHYPLAPLCLEVLFIQIRNDLSTRGFKFDNIVLKLTSFADDVTFLVKDVQSLKRIVKGFELFSSLKMNVEKCEACWIGNSKSKAVKPVQCKWISLKSNTIKILGTHFSYDKILEQKMNFSNLRIECHTISGNRDGCP